MSLENVLVPATGNEGELEVIEVSVAVGEKVEIDQTIVVLESDKATVEVPSTKAGIVDSIAVSVGNKVKEGSLLICVNEIQASGQTIENKVEEKLETNEQDIVANSLHNSQVSKLVVPELGGADQVEIIELNIEEGQKIEKDQTILVLESDKASMEIPSSMAGTILQLRLKKGDKVSAGDIIAEIELIDTDNPHSMNKQTEKVSLPIEKESKSYAHPETNEVIKEGKQTIGTSNSGDVHAGPSVRKFAREHGVDLARVKPSGPKNRILAEDVTAYIKSNVQLAQSGAVSSSYVGLEPSSLPDFKQFGEVSASSFTKVHQKTAENMQRSWSVPHVTQFDEADITELEAFRLKQKAMADSKGIKLTPMPFLLKACAHALKSLPQFNVSLDIAQQKVIQKHYIHIGFAVDTPHGLFVPVVRDVDKKGIWELAKECQDLASKARDKKLSPADMQGGCFTISSLGAIGGTAFTPIVNTPEVAILGVSKAQMKPIYIGQDKFEARLMLPLSLSYDHRAVNGADGARFTSLLGKVIGDIRELLL